MKTFGPVLVLMLALSGLYAIALEVRGQSPSGAPQQSVLKLKTERGWVELSAPTGVAFVVDGEGVQIEGLSTEPMVLERDADGFSMTCNGWTYHSAGAFSMSKDGQAIVVREGGTPAKAADEDEGTFPADRIKVVGSGSLPDEDEPKAATPREPAAEKPKP